MNTESPRDLAGYIALVSSIIVGLFSVVSNWVTEAPQRRIYMNTAQQVCGGSFLSKELFFLITNKSGKGEIEQLRCDQLE